jgi:hypothetical protein
MVKAEKDMFPAWKLHNVQGLTDQGNDDIIGLNKN